MSDDKPSHFLSHLATAIMVAVITSAIQYQFGTKQITQQLNEDFLFWQKQEGKKKTAEIEERKRQLIWKVRELHERLLATDTRFWFASEMNNLELSILGFREVAGDEKADRLLPVFEYIRRSMGLDNAESYFSDASKEYTDVRIQLIALLTETDMYFSHKVMAAAQRYYNDTSQAKLSGEDRANFWSTFITFAAREIISGKSKPSKIADQLLIKLHEAKEKQEYNLHLYNELYAAMRSEVQMFKPEE